MWIRRTCNLLLVVIILLGNLVDFVSTGYAESTPSQEQGQEKKAKDVTVLQGKSDMNIMGLSPNEVVVADGKKGSNLFDFEAFIKPSDIEDEMAPLI